MTHAELIEKLAGALKRIEQHCIEYTPDNMVHEIASEALASYDEWKGEAHNERD